MTVRATREATRVIATIAFIIHDGLTLPAPFSVEAAEAYRAAAPDPSLVDVIEYGLEIPRFRGDQIGVSSGVYRV